MPPAVQVALGAALIGLAPIGVRLSELGPQATALWRFAFALPLLALLHRLEGSPLPRARLPMLLLAGLCFGADIALWHAALTLTTVLNATLISNMTPILAALAGWLLFKERIGGAFLAGAAAGLAGVLLLSYARASGAPGASGPAGLWGDLIALGSCVWYAAYLILLRRERNHASARATMLVTTFAALVFALVVTLAAGEALIPQTLNGWLVLIALGIVSQVGGQGLIAEGLGQLPISVSTVLLWVQPVAAAAFSWILFGESLGPLALAGAGLALGGVWVVQRGRST
jgi:drug/metabolite transporter (DMT)-like permease